MRFAKVLSVITKILFLFTGLVVVMAISVMATLITIHNFKEQNFKNTEESKSFMDRDLGKQVAKFDQWVIYKSIDSMTDQVDCVATLQNEKNIHIGSDSATINIKNIPNPTYFQHRFDTEKASQIEFITPEMAELGALLIEEDNFNKLIKAKRLRIQVSTIDVNQFEFDFNMSGIHQAHEYILGPECK